MISNSHTRNAPLTLPEPSPPALHAVCTPATRDDSKLALPSYPPPPSTNPGEMLHFSYRRGRAFALPDIGDGNHDSAATPCLTGGSMSFARAFSLSQFLDVVVMKRTRRTSSGEFSIYSGVLVDRANTGKCTSTFCVCW